MIPSVSSIGYPCEQVVNRLNQKFSKQPSSCQLLSAILLISTLASIVPPVRATASMTLCNLISLDPDLMPECDISARCASYWERIVVVPEGMSPVNALRALQLGNPGLFEKEPGKFRDPLYFRTSREDFIEAAFQATGFGQERPGGMPFWGGKYYVKSFGGLLVETDFTHFPFLDASRFDYYFGKGAAQKAIDRYYLLADKLDVGDKTLGKMRKLKELDTEFFEPCFTYAHAPTYAHSHLKNRKFRQCLPSDQPSTPFFKFPYVQPPSKRDKFKKSHR